MRSGEAEGRRHVQSHCPLCSMQCGIDLITGRGGRLEGLEGRVAHPVNQGRLCILGRGSERLVDHPERLTRPLIRRAGQLEPASWDEALDTITERLQAIRATSGAEAVALYGGASLSNEKCYLFGKFGRLALRTPHIDYNGRYCMSSAAAAAKQALGIDRGLNNPLADLEAADCIILAGSNAGECQQTMVTYFNRMLKSGGTLIAIDPRATVTARRATLHLAVRPGADMALANGLMHVLIAEELCDWAFIGARTRGFDAVARAVAEATPERTAAITGVPAGQIVEAARMFGRAKNGMVLTARGVDQHARGVETTLAFINLALATGNFGRAGAGYGTLTGQGNGQGAREHGQKSDQLPGYRAIDDPAARRHVAGVWGVPQSWLGRAGYSAYEILDAAGRGEIRALFVQASNPVVSSPNAGYVQRALAELEALVVVDVFMSETAELADVVLPGALWAEDDGTTTNLEGRVVLRRKAVEPPGEARPEWWILSALAERMGAGAYFRYSSSEAIFDELCRASRGGPADYGGLTYARLAAEEGVFWPCPDASHPGTPRLFETHFAHRDGRARFCAVTYEPAGERPDAEYPLLLTTGRVRHHYLSGAQTRRIEALDRQCPGPYAEMHPDTANRLGLADEQPVELATRRGAIIVPLRLSAQIRPDTVFVPFHWGGEHSVNRLTDPELDPISRMPQFKACALRVRAAPVSCAGLAVREGIGAPSG